MGSASSYIKISSTTPEKILAHSWRHALQEKSKKIIQIEWLRKVNEILRNKLNIPRHVLVEEACWDEEDKYERFLALSAEIIKEYNPKQFMIDLDNRALSQVQMLKDTALIFLEKFDSKLAHKIFTFPYEQRLQEFAQLKPIIES